MRTVFVTDFSKITLRIYTIGYSQQGESVLCVFLEDERPLFSLVVDSFCVKGPDVHAICNILDALDVRNLDMFVWTHPDFDHSVGIEDILDSHDLGRDAEIFITEGIYNSNDILKPHAKKVYEYLETNYNTRSKHNLSKVSLIKNEIRRITPLEFFEAKSGRVVTCDFLFVAPMSSWTIRQEFNVSKDYNAMSIMFAMSVNKINYLFCGDVEDPTLSQINSDVFQNAKFVKIPHHGSDTSRRVIDYLVSSNTEDAVAVTTVFTANGLPKDNVIQQYKSCCECAYCTSTGKEPYGCVQLDFNIIYGNWDIVMSGNAAKLF